MTRQRRSLRRRARHSHAVVAYGQYIGDIRDWDMKALGYRLLRPWLMGAEVLAELCFPISLPMDKRERALSRVGRTRRHRVCSSRGDEPNRATSAGRCFTGIECRACARVCLILRGCEQIDEAFAHANRSWIAGVECRTGRWHCRASRLGIVATIGLEHGKDCVYCAGAIHGEGVVCGRRRVGL